MHDFKSHFQRDFLAYCTRPVSVHLAMVSVSCLFNSFSIFLLSLKQQQNLMKIMFSCIHFPAWPYPPQNNEKNVFYTGKLYRLTGMQCGMSNLHAWWVESEVQGRERGRSLERMCSEYIFLILCSLFITPVVIQFFIYFSPHQSVDSSAEIVLKW